MLFLFVLLYIFFFYYFDKEKRGVINYKQFSHDIFNLKNKEQNDYPFSSNDFPTILSNHLIHKGGNLSLINLIKNLKIKDYNNSNRMTIDDFLKVLNESYLGLEIHLNTICSLILILG